MKMKDSLMKDSLKAKIELAQNSKRLKIFALFTAITLVTVSALLAISLYSMRNKPVVSSQTLSPTPSQTPSQTPSPSPEPPSDPAQPEEPTPDPAQPEDPSTTPAPAPNPNQVPPPAPAPAPQPEPTPNNWWSYPSPTLQTTRSGNDLLVLVNKQYQLPSTYAPSDLVALNQQNLNIRITQNFYARSIMVNDLRNLANAAQNAGLDLSIISAYRSFTTQQSTYQYWVNYNGGNTDAADQVSARAGHSQHQLGTAVDFSSGEVNDQIGAAFHNTAAAAWLAAHAWEYGFVIAYPAGHEATTRYAYESWHYRYIGVENAAQWKASGQILESWLVGRN